MLVAGAMVALCVAWRLVRPHSHARVGEVVVGVLTGVVDASTVEMEDDAGAVRRLRLTGVTAGAEEADVREELEAYLGAPIRALVTAGPTDSAPYAYVQCRGVILNELVIERGLAHASTEPHPASRWYRRVERVSEGGQVR